MPGATGGNTITSTNQIANGVIEDADVNAAAAIAASKIAGDVETTGDQTIAGVKTFSSIPIVPDDAYAAGWNGSNEVPTKNAIYDKIESLQGQIPIEELGVYVGTGTESAKFRVCVDKTNSIMIVQDTNGSKLHRFIKDANSLQWKWTHTVSDTNGGGGAPYIWNNYVWKAYYGGSQVLKRYDLADLANETTISYSGGTPDGNVVFGSGSNLYVYHSSSVFKKYTVSGTTATYVADVTYTSAGVVVSACTDDTYVYTTIDPTSGPFAVKKYPIAGGAASSTTSLNDFNDGYPAFSPNSIFIPRTGILGFGFFWSSKDSATFKGVTMRLHAVTQP